jgi:hypothetical protein
MKCLRTALKDALQAMWEQSLAEGLRISLRSAVPVLDGILREHQANKRRNGLR